MNTIIQGQDLIIGNVGDSRAVLATRDKDNALVAVQLTVDLKPNLPSIPLSHTHAINIPMYAHVFSGTMDAKKIYMPCQKFIFFLEDDLQFIFLAN